MSLDPEDGSTHVKSDSSSRRSPIGERFTPGLIVGERYRIISLIGEGGMGEVYRADDLKLGQRVALKYVPRALAHDAAAMEQLISEVRIGRQISHPNVCRLYDIAEVDGEHFIAMEFVEGEDLASLLRRIGRLPADKALAFAIDICAGLAAAHDRGVIHRDLKPANILIDEHGNARITDFGLASIAADTKDARDLSGTPAYMAPEQLMRGEVSFRSDIYSLGLVLYEVFTGRRLFGGRTYDDIREQHAITKTKPSSIVKDIHPAVERVILRCVEENPAERPPSIHAVIAALPGGDPLQAAVAAGETPSPAMVAAAGRVGDLSLPTAWGLLGGIILLLIGATAAGTNFSLPARLGGIKPEPVLKERAREIAAATGAPAPLDSWSRWYIDGPYRSWRGKAEGPLPPGRLLFVYRQSPEVLVSTAANSRISQQNPAPTVPGMSTVVLDNQGRLVSVRTIPPSAGNPAAVRATDWTKFLDASGIDLSTLRPADPQSNPPIAFDHRQAWVGMLPSLLGVPMRIEAASLGGTPVWFDISGPWRTSAPVQTPDVGENVLAAMEVIATLIGAVLARRNVVRGRADRRSAIRLFLWIAALYFIALVAVADHVPSLVEEWALIGQQAATSIFFAGIIWVLYLAVEPYLRRGWPHMLISWTRLMKGRLRDPMVGRDLLIGAAGGLIGQLVWLTLPELLHYNTLASPIVTTTGYSSRFGLLWTFGFYSLQVVLYAFGMLTWLLLFRIIMRRPVFAAIALWVVTTPVSIMGVNLPIELAASAAMTAVWVVVLYRYGALALCSAFFFGYVSGQFYSVSDVRSILPIAALAGITLFAFHVSLAGKPIFGALAIDEEAAAS